MTVIGGGNTPPKYDPAPIGLPANPAANLRKAGASSQTDPAGPNDSYVNPKLFQGADTAKYKLASYVNARKKAGDPASLDKVMSSLSESELRDVDAFFSADRELNASVETLTGLAQRCDEFVRTAAPTQVAKAGEKDGLLYNIRVEVEKIKELLEGMITLNSRLRYDQIDRRLGSVRPPGAPLTLAPGAGERSNTSDDAMQAKQEVESGLLSMLERMNGFLAFFIPNEPEEILFELDEVQDLNKQAKLNRAALKEAAATFSENLLPDESAKLMAREVAALNLRGVQQVAVRSLTERGESPLKIFYIKNILLPFIYVFNREKLLSANTTAVSPDINKVLQEFFEKKSAQEADSESVDGLW